MQLKDIFFENNPDFQWYKFPEPTRRSIMVRPYSSLSLRSYDDNSDDIEVWNSINENPTNNNHLTKINFNVEPSTSKPESDFTPGKLADEAQMGGLNSLILGSNESRVCTNQNNLEIILNEKEQQNPAENPESFKLKKLQDELLETSKVFESLDEDNGEHDFFMSRKRLFSDVSSESDDLRLPQRSCKGKRYEELKNNWGVINNKRPRKEMSNRLNHKSTRLNSWKSFDNYDSESELVEGDQRQRESESSTESSKGEDVPKKVPKLCDFDLDKELAALKPLDYDAYLAKKRDNLTRKKNPIYHSTSKSKLSMDERNMLREQTKSKLVGSGKRKPKKDSITRLEFNSTIIQSEVNKNILQISITPETSAMDQSNSIEFRALETLAEVASKLYESTEEKLSSQFSM